MGASEVKLESPNLLISAGSQFKLPTGITQFKRPRSWGVTAPWKKRNKKSGLIRPMTLQNSPFLFPGASCDGAALGVGDASRNRKRHSLAIQTYTVVEGALGRRGHIEWAKHGRLSRPRGLSVVNGVNQHGYSHDVG